MGTAPGTGGVASALAGVTPPPGAEVPLVGAVAARGASNFGTLDGSIVDSPG
jgi:hypothetical protein